MAGMIMRQMIVLSLRLGYVNAAQPQTLGTNEK
jgi:hypothetical protein